MSQSPSKQYLISFAQKTHFLHQIASGLNSFCVRICRLSGTKCWQFVIAQGQTCMNVRSYQTCDILNIEEIRKA